MFPQSPLLAHAVKQIRGEEKGGEHNMLITEKTCESLNRILQLLFGGNAEIYNLCYNLQYMHLNNIASALHEPVAHKMPELADEVSDFMDQLGCRAVRYSIGDHDAKYESAADIFSQLAKYFEELRKDIIIAIDDADMNDDVEARIWLENFLVEKVLPLRKQAAEWLDASGKLSDEELNIHIADYTHYLK